MTQAGPQGERRTRLAFVGDAFVVDGDWADWYPDREVVVLGDAADTTDDLLQRFDGIVAARPDEIVVEAGGNDFASARASVEHVVRGIQNLMVGLRRELPESRLLIVSIPPRAREHRDRIRDANRHLRQFAPSVHAHYLDLWPVLADDEGALEQGAGDARTHLTAAGYALVRDELTPALARLRDEPPMSGVIHLPKLPAR